MLKILVIFIVGIIACYFIAKAILKFIPKKVQPIISLLLWAAIIWLSYITYQNIMKPIKFNQEKTERYSKVIKSLKVVRDAQAAHKKVTGTYAKNGNSLIQFIDTAKFAITESRNELKTEQRGGGLTEEVEYRVIDTVGYSDVRAVFTGREYKNLMKVPGTDANFVMTLGKVQKTHGYMAPVYEVKVSKDVVLHGMDADLLRQEKEAIENDQIKGDHVRVGSLKEVSDSGNWPPSYDKGDNKK
ncbi:MAG: hypothetical protein L3J14_04665 [Flavobacteriaceae bacterium]|nr:hypothetical protein [Flavobacteriaceae bacterium]